MAISSRGESPLTFNWCFMAKVFIEPVNERMQMNPDLELVAFCLLGQKAQGS